MTVSLLVDIGNSALKLAYQETADIQAVTRWPHGDYQLESLLDDCLTKKPFVKLGLASVYEATMTEQVARWCALRQVEFVQAQTATNAGGLVNGYRQSSQLGVDRWLGMLALWLRRRASFCLVSCGTAVTMDVVNNDGQHLGGLILPSPKLMLGALSSSTSALTADEMMVATSSRLADNTDDAMSRGCWNAVAALVAQVCGANGLPANAVFLTGGCAASLAGLLADGVKLQQDLVLTGLADYMNKVASS